MLEGEEEGLVGGWGQWWWWWCCEGTRGLGDIRPSIRGVIDGCFFHTALFSQGADHGCDVLRRKKRVGAEGARAETFFDADDFAAVETVWRCG